MQEQITSRATIRRTVCGAPGVRPPAHAATLGRQGGARKASGRGSRRGPASGPPIIHAADPMGSSVPRAASGTDTARASGRASRRINHGGPTHDEIQIRTMSLFGRSALVRPANVCPRCAWLLRDWVLFGIRLPDWCWRNKKSEEMLEKLMGNRCAGGTICCDARTRSISPRKDGPMGVLLAFGPVDSGRSGGLGQRRGGSRGALVWPSDAPRLGGIGWKREHGYKRHGTTRVEASKDMSFRRSGSTLTQDVTVLRGGGPSACPRQEMRRDSRVARTESLAGG